MEASGPGKLWKKNKVKVWPNFLEDLSVYTLFDVFFDCMIENGRSTTYSNRKNMQKNNINIKNHKIKFNKIQFPRSREKKTRKKFL